MHFFFRDSALKYELVVARIINGRVAQDSRETRWTIVGEIPVVAEVNRRRIAEMQERGKCFVGVMAVNDVGRCRELGQVVNYRHSLFTNLSGERTQTRTVNDGMVARLE